MNLTKQTKLTLVYIGLAFLFSVAIRMIWIYQFNGYEPFIFNNQFMINTNDGYYFAEGARDILSGVSQSNDRSPLTSATSILTAFFVKLLPFSFESVILYMPVFLSSLIVIPIILIAKNLQNLEMGFIAALVGSVAWSYYNRTMVGYYDTDMLNVVLPTFLLWSIIWAVNTNEDKYLLITALDILVYRWWYPASYSLEFAFIGMIVLYTLLWDRKNLYNYKLLALMLFAMMNLDGSIRLVMVLGVFYIFKQEKFNKYIYYILGLSIAAFLLTGGLSPIWAKLQGYIFARGSSALGENMALHFYSVVQTVREAGKIPFETFANRISGHPITFVLSLVGYVWLVLKHRVMLFALPLLGLGFLAYEGGLRFTVYAVPVMALSIAFLFTQSVEYLSDKKSVQRVLLTLLSLLVLLPNIYHIYGYRVPTVFKQDEVKVLEQLKSIASREDYVISWWDYGYPIRYYADVKTLVDGGKHSGGVNFPVSFILTNPQEVAAKMARLDVEYTQKRFLAKGNFASSNIAQMSKDYGYDDSNDFLTSLEMEIRLPQKTRDIYLYLPYRMMDIYPTVKVFSNLDLNSGVEYKRPLFYVTRNFKNNNGMVHLGNNISLNLKDSSISIGRSKQPLRRFTSTQYDQKGKLQVQEKLMNFNAQISVIYMKNYNTFLVVDEQTYNSTYIQMMALERYDEKLFEQVLLTPHVKVYKLKI